MLGVIFINLCKRVENIVDLFFCEEELFYYDFELFLKMLFFLVVVYDLVDL